MTVIIVLLVLFAICWLGHYAIGEAVKIERRNKFEQDLKNYGESRKKRRTNRK
jgi:hypothetical protein